MNNKWAMVIGLLIGLVFGLMGVLATLHFATAEMDEKQAEAYDQGVEAGLKRAGSDGIDISGRLNTSAIQGSLEMRQQLDGVKTALAAFQSRDDLTPQAQDQLALIIEGLK